MVDEADLEVNVLEFVHKSFDFARLASHAGRELVLFHRTETESESRFRPKLVRLYLALPREWVILDGAEQMLLIARDGKTIGLRTVGEAVEAAAEATEFVEQGILFHRLPIADKGWLYVPVEILKATAPAALIASLGLGPS